MRLSISSITSKLAFLALALWVGDASAQTTTIRGGNSANTAAVSNSALSGTESGLVVRCASGCAGGGGGGTQYAEDTVHVSGDTGTLLLGVRNDSASTGLSGTNGDYTPIATDSNGRIFVNTIAAISSSVTPGTSAGNLGKAEDAVHASSDTGVMLLGVRKDTASALAGTDGDYQPAIFDGTGQLYVNCGNCAGGTQYDEDAAETAGGKLSMAGTVRRDTAASSAGTTGDNATLNTDATGRLWSNTELPDAAALADATANPTVPGIGSYNMCWNGSTWDRCAKSTAGNGATDSSTQRVTIANDSTGVLATVNNVATIGTSVTPGTSAAHLGKAEDAAHASSDTGVLSLAVRQDTISNSTSADGDYGALKLNSAGRLYTSTTIDAAIPAGSNVIGALTANQSVNVAQMNGVAVTMGAGATGTGVQRVNPVSSSATGAAPPASGSYTVGLGSGATGGFLVGVPVGDTFVPISVTSATTTLLVTGVSGRHVRITSLNLVSAIANNVALISGTGATCGTGTAGIAGGTTAANGWNFAANGGLTIGSGLGTVMRTVAAGDSVCIVTSSAGPLAGSVGYAIY